MKSPRHHELYQQQNIPINFANDITCYKTIRL